MKQSHKPIILILHWMKDYWFTANFLGSYQRCLSGHYSIKTKNCIKPKALNIWHYKWTPFMSLLRVLLWSVLHITRSYTFGGDTQCHASVWCNLRLSRIRKCWKYWIKLIYTSLLNHHLVRISKSVSQFHPLQTYLGGCSVVNIGTIVDQIPWAALK